MGNISIIIVHRFNRLDFTRGSRFTERAFLRTLRMAKIKKKGSSSCPQRAIAPVSDMPQEPLVRPETTSLAPKQSVNFRSPYQTSDGYASSKVSLSTLGYSYTSDWNACQVYTLANRATSGKLQRTRRPPPPSTTHAISNISFTNPSSTSSETTRRLRRRLLKRLEEMNSAMRNDWSVISLLA